jgi:signal transduction histidine kinase
MIVQRAAQVVKADRGLILLVNVQARELEKMVWYGYENEDLAGLDFQEVEDGISGWVLAHGRPVISEDMVSDARNTGLAFNRAAQENPRGQSIIVAPLMVRDDVIGTLTTISEEGNKTFDRADMELVLLLANQAAIAIENARLYQASKAYTVVLEQRVSERTAELTVALREAQEADRLKSSFISDINHELRTPLNNLGLYLSFIERGSPKKREEYLNIVRRETERLQWLISQLLDFSLLDAGTLAANLEPVDLNQLASTLINDRRQLAQDKNLTLAFAAATELPPALADPKLLFQVLTNLLSNAINYTFPGGKVVVHSDLQERDGRTWVTISVKDNGLGISEEDQAQLFERFYRGVAAEITKASGAGLGLSICKEITDQHGGQITVKSQLGQGSSFTLWLQPA